MSDERSLGDLELQQTLDSIRSVGEDRDTADASEPGSSDDELDSDGG